MSHLHRLSFCFRILFIALELSSVALGGKIVKVSDEFFAEAFHLLLVEVSRSRATWHRFSSLAARYFGSLLTVVVT